MAVKPIKPNEVKTVKIDPSEFPDEVIAAFNEMIAKNMQSWGESTFKQKDVVALIAKKMRIRNTGRIYSNNWLDVEAMYRQQGWTVNYDKPGYCEDYDATFKFSKK